MTGTAQLAIGSARRITIAVPGGPVAALQAGAEAGPNVLLVPGFTGSKEDFGPLLDPLSAAGFRITAVDLPGQFESPGPDDPAAYTPEALGGSVRALAQELGAPVHLVGHSFGGLVARAAVVADPALFRDLVLMSSGPAALRGPRRDRIDLLEPVLAAGGKSGVYAAMQAAAATEPGYLSPPPELEQFLARRFHAGSSAMLTGMSAALRTEPDRTAELLARRMRCLVLHGADDDAWPPSVQADMAGRLAARYVVVPGAAHSPAIEAPAPTAAALLGFWDATGRVPGSGAPGPGA